jgi:hypothetical protein
VKQKKEMLHPQLLNPNLEICRIRHAASSLQSSAASDDANAASLLSKPISLLNTYWDSTEAKKIFQPTNEE